MVPDEVTAFANNLIQSLDTNAEPNITNLQIQCSGHTKHSNRCKNYCNVHFTNEDAVPTVFCTTHKSQDTTNMDQYNLVIEELSNNTHVIKELSSTNSPILEFIEFQDFSTVDEQAPHSTTDECYATQNYNDTGKLSCQSVITKDTTNITNLFCDMTVFISENASVKIFYIKKIGIIKYNYVPSITRSASIEYKIETKLNFDKTDTCAICHDEKDLYSLGCDANHSFCTQCISKLYKKEIKCPMCRSNVSSLDSIEDKLNIFHKQLSSPACVLKTYTLLESDKIVIELFVANKVVLFCLYNKELADLLINIVENHLFFIMKNNVLYFADIVLQDLLTNLKNYTCDESELLTSLKCYLEDNTY